eukprot:NODE_315_length_2468_cov_37.716412_g292_i0.p1 GENE.NODE_315_length_2468_cov_37.716412_g292_i0~~NODE_315_length_2468_cov_37.716412_g292_i0.p1  ORF type:complete len:724 (+),score=164.18 NODE_315_length_2468_cov_37.716412_g292_i0:117-2288(+)
MGFQRGEVPVSGLLNFLTKQAAGQNDRPEKVRFILVLVVFTLSLLLHRIETEDRDEYDISESAKQVLDYEKFSEVQSDEEYWDWLTATLEGLWTGDDDSEGEVADERIRPALMPLGLVVIRQVRVNSEKCEPAIGENVFPESVAKYLEEYQQRVSLEGTDISTEPFGPDAQWKCVGESDERLYSSAIDGPVNSYPDLDKMFFQVFEISHPWKKIQAQIENLKENNWFDLATRVVSTECIMFSQATKSYVHPAFIIERSARGLFVPRYIATPFTYQHWGLKSFRSCALFFLDFLVVAYMIAGSIGLVKAYRARKRMALSESLVTFGEFSTATLLLFMAGAYLYRIQCWLAGTSMNSKKYLANHQDIIDSVNGGNALFFMFDHLVSFGELQEQMFYWFAIAYLIGWVRLLLYVRHNPRLNALTQTMSECIGQLLGMTTICVMVIFGYVALGTVLYGKQIPQFRSPAVSFGTLAGILLGVFDTWEDMTAMEPTITPIYVWSYFAICWLVLLNMVVGVIGASFDAVQETMEEPDWSLAGMTGDLLSFLTGKEIYLGGEDDGDDEEDAEKVTMPALPALVTIINTLHQTPTTHITPDDFLALLPPDVSDAQGEYILEGGRHEYAGKQPSTINMERAVETIYETVEGLPQVLDELRDQVIGSVSNNMDARMNPIDTELENFGNNIGMVKRDMGRLQSNTATISDNLLQLKEPNERLEQRIEGLEALLRR